MEMSRLEKIDIIRERTGLGYAEAATWLDEADGDVVEALIRFESAKRKADDSSKSAWGRAGDQVLEQIKALVRKGNVTRLRVKRQGRMVLEVPVTAGVVGAVIAPELALIGAAACLVTGCTLEVESADGAVESFEFGGEDGRP